ncbi:hypothetical protein K502DRAFT_342549 [Neoconidiobolus thromboides FSU 785]|nr:hypothetical protein K502DRAFT_342549 [Neoconidiobolus thromboides FSU 785]
MGKSIELSAEQKLIEKLRLLFENSKADHDVSMSFEEFVDNFRETDVATTNLFNYVMKSYKIRKNMEAECSDIVEDEIDHPEDLAINNVNRDEERTDPLFNVYNQTVEEPNPFRRRRSRMAYFPDGERRPVFEDNFLRAIHSRNHALLTQSMSNQTLHDRALLNETLSNQHSNPEQEGSGNAHLFLPQSYYNNNNPPESVEGNTNGANSISPFNSNNPVFSNETNNQTANSESLPPHLLNRRSSLPHVSAFQHQLAVARRISFFRHGLGMNGETINTSRRPSNIQNPFLNYRAGIDYINQPSEASANPELVFSRASNPQHPLFNTLAPSTNSVSSRRPSLSFISGVNTLSTPRRPSHPQSPYYNPRDRVYSTSRTLMPDGSERESFRTSRRTSTHNIERSRSPNVRARANHRRGHSGSSQGGLPF